jgi:hypothetical protein
LVEVAPSHYQLDLSVGRRLHCRSLAPGPQASSQSAGLSREEKTLTCPACITRHTLTPGEIGPFV